MATREDFATAVGELIGGKVDVRPKMLTSTDDLDTLLVTRTYYQALSSVAGDESLGYPPGAVHGILDVTTITPGDYVSHVWWDTWNQWVAMRRRYNGTWEAWERITGETGGLPEHDHDDLYASLAPDALGSNEDLDTAFTPGRKRTIVMGTSGNPALHYPPGAAHGYLTIIDMNPNGASTHVAHEWVDTWGLWVARRTYYSGTWSDWERESGATPPPAPDSGVTVQPGTAVVYGQDRPDAWAFPDRSSIYWHHPDGTTVVPASYTGDGYVGALGAATGYSTMLVTKAEANGTVDVSCIDPVAQRHVTYRIQGEGNASWLDDMQIIEEIWIGAVTDGVPSKDIEVSPRSNMEFAFQIDTWSNPTFVPYHGEKTAIAATPATLTDSTGAPIDLGSLAIGDTITGLDGLKLRQSLYGRHPNTGTENWVRIDTTTTVSPDGLLQSETTWETLRDTRLGANYAPMTPLIMGNVDTLHVQDGGTYALDTTAPATTYYTDITEADQAESMLLTGPGDTFVAVSFLDPDDTLLRGHSQASTDTQMRVESRNNGWLKIYPSGFDQGSYIVSGTTWRTGAQWRFGETIDPAQYG